jgi:DNA polymerase delta subunit 2
MINVFLLGSPELVPRVLDVEKGQLCYIIGTVYMDMPLKPNVMEDIARDVRTLIEAFLKEYKIYTHSSLSSTLLRRHHLL